MNISNKHDGLKIADLIALASTICLQIIYQSIWVSRVNYIQMIGFNRITFKNLISLSLLVITWHVIFRILGVYQNRRIGFKTQDILDILKISSIATFIILIFSNIFWITFADKMFITNFWVGSSILILFARLT